MPNLTLIWNKVGRWNTTHGQLEYIAYPATNQTLCDVTVLWIRTIPKCRRKGLALQMLRRLKRQVSRDTAGDTLVRATLCTQAAYRLFRKAFGRPCELRLLSGPTDEITALGKLPKRMNCNSSMVYATFAMRKKKLSL